MSFSASATYAFRYTSVIALTSALSFGGYYGGAKLASKFLSENPKSTNKALSIFGGGALVGNYCAEQIRQMARNVSKNDPSQAFVLNATCLGTLIGSLCPMITCMGGLNKKETKETNLLAAAALVSTFVLNFAAWSYPQEESFWKVASHFLWTFRPF